MSDVLLLALPAAGYLVAGVLLSVSRKRPAARSVRLARVLVGTSVTLHAALILLRHYSQPAGILASARELLVLISWLAVCAYLLTAASLRGSGVSGPVLWGAGLTLLAGTLALPARPEAVPVILASPWLLLHVPLVIVAYLMYGMAGAASVMYLVVGGTLKSRRPVELLGRMPTLESLDRFSDQMAGIGFPFLTGGLIAGMLWSREAWGQLIPGSPKQVIALASWVIYAIHLYASVATRERGRLCAWLLVGGYVVVIAGSLVPTVSDGPHRFV